MARLRDARTSEIVFEGTPLECVVHARELGGATVPPILKPGETWDCPTELLYDDVGVKFDPDAVLEAAQENASGLIAAAADPELGDDERKHMQAAADRAQAALEADADQLGDAAAAIDAARSLQDQALSS